jgi:FAD/FMN-containing dehydrogenase
MAGQAFIDTLVDIVGPTQVLTSEDLTSSYVRDWTGRFVGSTHAVVRPGNVDEVARVMAACETARIPVVPQGGNTGLVGGGVPRSGEIVLSLTRLDTIGRVDVHARAVTVGAGATIAAVQHHAAQAGLDYAVDLASRGSATVGGTIATNAGGLRVMRFGATRSQVLGIEAVLSDGRVIRHLDGLVKDNTGYDLGGLLCGSEGTLAVVTAARLRLVPQRPEVAVALVGFASVGSAIAAAGEWSGAVDGVEAIEFMTASGIELVGRHLNLPPPFPVTPPALLLVEAAGRTDPTAALAEVVAGTRGVGEVAVAGGPADRGRLWRYREAHTEAINLEGGQTTPPHKLDVTLPQGSLAQFVEEVPAVVASVAPAAHTWLFGHAGDGNVHVNVTGVVGDGDEVDDAVLTLVASHGGSISAEHGIGTAKVRWLHLNRSATELEVFRSLRDAFDPSGILNPSVLVPR